MVGTTRRGGLGGLVALAAFTCSLICSLRTCARSKLAFDGDGSSAGDVFDRDRGDRRVGMFCLFVGGAGNREKDGDFAG